MKFIRTVTSTVSNETYLFEFVGSGLNQITMNERQTITQMIANDFTNVLTSYFPFDDILLDYIKWKVTAAELKLIDVYLKTAKLFYSGHENIVYSQTFDFDLGAIEAFGSGPKRAQDKIQVNQLASYFYKSLYEPLSFTVNAQD
jgi:aconitate hydratase